MKTRLTIAFLSIFLIVLTSCQEQKQEKAAEVEVTKVDLINDEFPEAKQEVMETFGAIAQSIHDGDMDKLISFHAYGPKFTEFKNGEPRNGGAENEAHERGVFGSVTEIVKFENENVRLRFEEGANQAA